MSVILDISKIDMVFPTPKGDFTALQGVDLQISKEIIRLNATVKLGSTNLLNNLHYEVYGGPYIGRMSYCSILFNIN